MPPYSQSSSTRSSGSDRDVGEDTSVVMAVKHKVVECVEPQAEARLTIILRALQSISTEHKLQGLELTKLCESIVFSLGTVQMPTKTEDYVKFMSDIRKIQEILVQACSSEDVIFTTLKALYNGISDSTKPRQPAMSIVLQLIDVEAIPNAVKWILHFGYSDQSLEQALMTLCNWLSRWTLTPNLGPLVLSFMQGLEAEQHYEILVEATLKYVERLFMLLILHEPRKTVGPVVLHMLSSMQHSPEAFHKVIPHTRRVVVSLHKENSESSLFYLGQIVNLFVALMNHFRGFEAQYEELMLAIEPFSPSLNYKQRLNCKSWVNGAGLVITTQDMSKRVGLNNLGNTCYMNSVLQALFMTKLFRNDILLTNREMMPLFAKLQILFALLQHSHRTSLSPSDILHLARPPGFLPGHQHDSSEFLGYLMDVLHEQERSVSASGRNAEGPATATTSAESQLQPATVIQRSFGGRAVTISRCGTCDTQSERADYFRELQLAFPNNCGNQSVQTLLDYYLQPEQLCEDNQYHCDTCHGLTDGERVTRVVEPPSRLVLTLKHFRYDPASQQRTKLLQQVKLDAFVHLDNVNYELYAAVVHVGSSLDSGHYYTFARDEQDWYKFNDCLVTRTTDVELCSVRPPETPYILFYSKQDCLDPDPVPRSALSSTLESLLVRDNSELDMERRRRPIKAYNTRHKRNDEPPPPGCGGGSFINANDSRYVC